MLRVTAVVVRWCGGAEVHRCLASLVANGGPHLADLILVDSGSADGGARRLSVHFPEARLVQLASNEGFAAAVNAGWAASGRHDAVLLVNPDCVLPSGVVSTLVRFLDRQPQCAGVVPRLVGVDGRSQHRWQLRRLPTPLRLATGRAGAAWASEPPLEAAPVPQPAAACWLVRRSVWEQLGGFDPRFRRAWWEDVDFCQRLQDGGLGQLWLVPDAVVRHIGGSSVGALPHAQFLEIFYGNLGRYARRHYPRQMVWIRPLLAVSLLVRGWLRGGQGAGYRSALTRVLKGPVG